jgi:predicted nucleotidyltransferase
MSQDVFAIRRLLRRRTRDHQNDLVHESKRLASAAAKLGVQRVVLFGSLARGTPGMTSDLDLLIVWDTPLDFVTRAAELYRRLKPRVAIDLLVYTPDEMKQMSYRPFVRHVLAEGKVLYEA